MNLIHRVFILTITGRNKQSLRPKLALNEFVPQGFHPDHYLPKQTRPQAADAPGARTLTAGSGERPGPGVRGVYAPAGWSRTGARSSRGARPRSRPARRRLGRCPLPWGSVRRWHGSRHRRRVAAQCGGSLARPQAVLVDNHLCCRPCWRELSAPASRVARHSLQQWGDETILRAPYNGGLVVGSFIN
jgi:hypothetical protein